MRCALPGLIVTLALLRAAFSADNPEREWAYDRLSRIGKLDKASDEAKDRGWTVVSMKDDWKMIFP